MRGVCLPRKKTTGCDSPTVVTTKSECSQSDSQAPMGLLAAAPIAFQAACDVPQGGALLALPALLAQGLMRYSPQRDQLPEGFYGLDSIFLLLGFMALAQIGSLEQLRYEPPGEWGNCQAWIASRKCGPCARSCNGCVRIWDWPCAGTRSRRNRKRSSSR
ncbi:MAG: hypothetical protein EXQ58_05345 [Acidobacteria bacterium]|nr:hypothetical protein [Acidobacteriota bacterium]